MRSPKPRRTRPFLALFLLIFPAIARGDDLPVVDDVPWQPFRAQSKRIVEALDQLGRPLPETVKRALDRAWRIDDERAAVKAIQEAIDRYCLIGVEINAEGRVKVAPGPAKPRLDQRGWKTFLVKVENRAGVTAKLKVESPNAIPVFRMSSGSPAPKPGPPAAELRDRWLDLRTFDERPLRAGLSGLLVEYRILELYSRDAGPREAKLSVNVGQGSQDLGFRSDLDLLFQCARAATLTLEVIDYDGKPTTASFIVRDVQGRLYPSPGRRLAPDFFFHQQIYRHDGETVLLPAGTYDIEYTRGPEYEIHWERVVIPEGATTATATFHLKRWANLKKMGWISGDHHVHAAGCAHYESPTEGVTPEVMLRHILGEDLDIGCVLSWGPCWYAQKKFFEGKVSKLSTSENLMRYDVEVSGFPSSHAGHLCLLRLKEDDYPGTTRIEEWPSWDLPILKWGKEQGGVVGFSHSGWGLMIQDETLPSYEVPAFDGIGADEYIADVASGAVDFISTVDTPAPWELNIWYHTLNCGFRTRISGETDFPCIYGERVGLGRVYVKLGDQKLDYDRWVEGLKDGRSYVSDGKSHLVDFRLDDVAVGESASVRKLDGPGNVTVRVKASAFLAPKPNEFTEAIRARKLSEKPYWDVERTRIGATRRVPVELIVNGKSVARQEIVADGVFNDLTFETKIDRSSWVALRVYPSSHTNPIFVEVSGKPVRASRKSAEWCLKGLENCWKKKEPAIRPSERAAAREAFDHARDAYRAALSEAADD